MKALRIRSPLVPRPGAGQRTTRSATSATEPVTRPTPSGHNGTPRSGRGRSSDASGAAMPARSSDGSVLSCVEIGEVVVEVAGRRIDLQVATATCRRAPTPCRRRSAGRRAATSTPPRCGRTPRPGPPASSLGSSSVSRNTSASTCWSPSRPRPRIRSGTHGSSVGIVTMIGVPSPGRWPSSAARDGVEPGGHEDRAALGVEVEHLGRVGGEEEAVLDGPRPHLVAAALEDGDVEGVDLRLEDHLGARRRVVGAAPAARSPSSSGRRDLLGQALQGPVAAALHRRSGRRAAGRSSRPPRPRR